MPARERIPDETRAAIEAAVRAGGTCRGVAREHGVSPGTVRNIAKEAGITGAFARVSTQNATRARVADLAARRSQLAERALDLAERMLDRATSPYTLVVATKDDVIREELPEPPAADVRQFATAYGIFVDKHCALIKFDTKEAANPAATSLADRLVAFLGLDQAEADDGYPEPLADATADAAGAAA